MKISVVLPTLNEEDAVEHVIKQIHQHLKGFEYEVIVVDSGTDNTANLASKCGAEVYNVSFHGYGNQVRYGLERATGNILTIVDCDGTYPIECIPHFIAIIESGFDMVTGNRLNNGQKNIPILNRLANKIFSTMIQYYYGIKILDISTGMKVFRKDLMDKIELISDCELPVELLLKSAQNNFLITEVSINYYERIGGKSKLKRISMGWKYLKFIISQRR